MVQLISTLTRTFYEASVVEEDIEGGVAIAATARRTARSMFALAPFAVTHTAGRPAVPSF
jgi:hypothetical protein